MRVQDATHSASALQRGPFERSAVDNTDWLKTAAIILVAVDHFGHFFMDNDRWWSTFGRMAAPAFFFLLGYAQTRKVPLHWLWLAAILTLLSSWNANWVSVTPNILFSFALIRLARPHAQALLERHGWVAFAFLACALFALVPATAKLVDYGAQGWLWALFGLCQRLAADRKAAAPPGEAPSPGPSAPATPENMGLMRLLACLIAALVYIWQEQREYHFPQIHFAVFVAGTAVLCVGLCLFRRGESPIQPPLPIAATLRFIGRHTLEIYAIQLAGSELLIKLVPDLAP
jgi:hypothetical protein